MSIQSAVSYNKSRGYSKDTWKQIQSTVGVTADGIPGAITAQAVLNWQRSHGLAADGCVGPATLGAIQKNGSTTNASSGSGGGSSAPAASANFNVDAAVKYNKGRGYSRDLWKQIQTKVGTTADGDPGKMTATAVYNWQKANGLTADGQCGPATLSKMGLSSSSGGGGTPGGGTVNYKQYANPWGPKMYSNHGDPTQTYATSACGPTSVANVIATKADSSVNPETMGNLALKWGHRTYNDGTARAFVAKACKQYGLSCSQVGVAEGIKQLGNGKLGVACMGPGYWTTGGHYITPYGYANGQVYVDDPGHSTRPNGFKQPEGDFKRQCNAFWIIG